MKKTKPSLPERIFGITLVLVAVIVLVSAVTQWITDTKRINTGAKIVHTTKIAPLEKAWHYTLPEAMKDPRSIQTWDYTDSQTSFAAQDAAAATGSLTQTQQLHLIKGTDGKTEIQIVALIDKTSGQAIWAKTYTDLPLDYCLQQMWQGAAVCESKTAKKIVTIHPDGNIIAGDLPGGIWDMATGPHVIGAVFDQFLVVPLAIAQGSSAGVEIHYIKPDFTYKGRYQLLVPNASAAQPITVQARGALTLVGALTSAADGSSRQHTWGYSQTLNLSQGSLDTSALGTNTQASLLEAGFFASADPDDTTQNTVKWQIYNPDGSIASAGTSPPAAVQAMHSQLRAGLTLDTTNTIKAMESGRIPVITPDRNYYLGKTAETCTTWKSCVAKEWQTREGTKINLTQPAKPILSSNNTVVFSTADNTLTAYGISDGKKLWEGILAPSKDTTINGDVFALGNGIAQLAQLGQLEQGTAKAVLNYWKLPDGS